MIFLSLHVETLPSLSLYSSVQATIFVLSSWVKESCHIQKTLFCSSLPWLLVLTLFLLPLLQWSLSIEGRVVIELSHLWLSTHRHLFSIVWLVLSFCFNCLLCTMKLTWWGLRTALINGKREKKIRGNLYYSAISSSRLIPRAYEIYTHVLFLIILHYPTSISSGGVDPESNRKVTGYSHDIWVTSAPIGSYWKDASSITRNMEIIWSL